MTLIWFWWLLHFSAQRITYLLYTLFCAFTHTLHCLTAMAKRVATQVHQQASRLLRENYLKKEPAWYRAVLEHPPLPLPAKAPPPRSEYDIPSDPSAIHSPTTKNSKAYSPRPLPIHYVEDELRRQFFSDHPFEAFRATSIVESAEIEAEHPIRGKEWTRLIQRGRNPSPEE